MTHGGKRRGAGRPRSDSAARIVVTVRLTEAEHARIVASGQRAGDYIRTALAVLAREEDEP